MAGLRGGGEPGPGEQGQDDARQVHQVGGDMFITSEGNIFIELEQISRIWNLFVKLKGSGC